MEVWFIMCRGVSADWVATRLQFGMQSAIFNWLSSDQALSVSSKLWNAPDFKHYHVRVCAPWTISPQIVVCIYVKVNNPVEQTRTLSCLHAQKSRCVLWKPKFIIVSTKACHYYSFLTRWIHFIFSQSVYLRLICLLSCSLRLVLPSRFFLIQAARICFSIVYRLSHAPCVFRPCRTLWSIMTTHNRTPSVFFPQSLS
jgi:hypothetical protein